MVKENNKACKFCSGRIDIIDHEITNKTYKVGECHWCGFRYTEEDMKGLKPYKNNADLKLKG